MARLVLANVRKSYRVLHGPAIEAVRDLSLTVEDGELMVLLGPSGCGKTTILRLIAGLERPDAGAIRIDDRAAEPGSPGDRDVAMVFQHHALYPHLTVFENLALGLRLRKLDRGEIEQRVGEAAVLVGLRDCLDRFPAELSGGQRQRVALGRALVRRPKLFLLDEPLSQLDPPLRIQLRREIARLQRRLGTSALYVTHDQTEALALGNRVAVLRDGALEQVGTPRTLYAEPSTLFVASFIGSPPMNLIRGRFAETRDGPCFECANGGPVIPVPPADRTPPRPAPGRDLILGLRPQQIAVRNLPPGTDADRLVRVPVESVELCGPECQVQVRLGSQSILAFAPTDPPLTAGTIVALEAGFSRAVCFDPATGRAIRQEPV